MKAITTFAHAIADETSLRLLHLTVSQWRSVAELESALQVSPAALATQLTLLSEAALLKAVSQKDAVGYRVKRRHQSLVKSLFTHFDVTAKTEKLLRADTKLAKEWRTEVAKRAKAEKLASKKSKPTPAAKSTKPSKPAKKKS